MNSIKDFTRDDMQSTVTDFIELTDEELFNAKKRLWLNKLRKEKEEYKAYNKLLLFPYAGSKAMMIGYLLEELKYEYVKNGVLVSPFLGGASFELFLNIYFNMKIYGYDINYPLISFFKLLIKERLVNILTDRKNKLSFHPKYLKEYKKILLENLYSKKSDITEDLLGVYFFITQSLVIRGIFQRDSFPLKYEDILAFVNKINFIKKLHLNNFFVEHLDFRESIQRHNFNFIYADPPYYMNAKYYVDNNCFDFDHIALFNLLDKHKGGFMLSYNNCEFISRLYSSYKQRVISRKISGTNRFMEELIILKEPEV